MKKTRIIATLLALTMGLSVLAGCSGNGSPDSNSPGESSSTIATYPSEDIACLVPYAAGGGTDNIARAVASHIDLPVSVACSIMTGAGGLTGSQEFSTQPGDGYHIMSQSPLDLIFYYLTGGSEEKLWEKMEPLPCMVIDPGIVITNPASGIASLEDLKSMDPAELTWGFIGARQQTVTIQLLQGLGLEGATQVPYDSGSDAITAVMGNHVDVSFMQVGDLGSTLDSGDITPLLIVDEKRSDRCPDVPCTAELGIEATGAQYRAFFAAGGTDPDYIQYLSSKMEELQDDPEYLTALEGYGFVPGFIPADEMSAKIEEWYNTFAPIYEQYVKQ